MAITNVELFKSHMLLEQFIFPSIMFIKIDILWVSKFKQINEYIDNNNWLKSIEILFRTYLKV